MPSPKGTWFLPGFGLKTGVDFAHFGLDLGMVFEGTQWCMDVLVISVSIEYERKLEWIFRNLFLGILISVIKT